MLPKINAFHLQGPANAGKTYIISSIREGIVNYGAMRCRDEDAFTFANCVDSALMYTDELQSYSHNVDQAKVILEGGTTHVNVKNNPERLMRRTPCLSTSNTDSWLTIPGEEPNLKARMHYHNLENPMPKQTLGSKKTNTQNVDHIMENIHPTMGNKNI